MSSSSRCCATGAFVLPSLLLLPLLLSLALGVQGATLREHRLSGAEPGSYGPASQIHPPPSAEMLRALRYIQSLSRRTPPDPLADEDQPEREDMESVRSMLRMASPARVDRGAQKDNTQELLQAVLTTLQQTEERVAPQKTAQKVTANPPYPIHPFPKPLATSAENYRRGSWVNSDERRQHRQFPLLFEDEDDQEQPLKRTNENAEEQYTPQKLATLQSVFEELSGIAASKANSRRDDGEEEDDEDNDLYRQRKTVLEDIMGTDDWAPPESEEEEDERENRKLEDDDQEDEEEEDVDDVKRSDRSDWFRAEKEEEPEDIAKLVDYYLLKMLEKKEREQQRRQEARRSEEETDREAENKDVDEDEEEREVKSIPESLSQVIKISQKFRIPPEEVLELLQNEKQKDVLIPPYANARKTAAPHQRPLETSDANSVAQDILSLLELVSVAQQNKNRPTQPQTPRYYERETGRDDYDDTAGEDDELANYLASEMQRRARLTPLRDEDQPAYGNLERAVQDYFKNRQPEKRHVETQENAAAAGLDNNTMMKILRYLDPESDDVDETDSEKTVPEM